MEAAIEVVMVEVADGVEEAYTDIVAHCSRRPAPPRQGSAPPAEAAHWHSSTARAKGGRMLGQLVGLENRAPQRVLESGSRPS